MPDQSSAYQPQLVEPEIYQRWEASGYFNPDNLPDRRGKPFVISMPPPNITGELHVGHVPGLTIQDLLIRFARMRGRKALWVPGTDHAAIATQVMVERELRKEGLDRRSLGREKFLERVWVWKQVFGRRIIEQIKRLGASADWSRERFTMDEGMTKAVQEAFIRLYNDGLIYRGERIVNWCPGCQTGISDLEVEHEPSSGTLWFIRYPLSDQSGSILVATTRPETMLGDTAVAVHPDDQRYREYVGKTVRLPIVGREIPIVADAKVEKGFGTGAVKVTPAHDQLDWEIAQSHKLPAISVVGTDGRMTPGAGQAFMSKAVEEARQLVIEELRAGGWLERQEDYVHAIATCSRSKDVIQPLLSTQWFVKAKPLAEKALQAVRKGSMKILPERYEKVYFRWLENIRDWNISRQIWWGHRLPVWYRNVGTTEEIRVAIESPGPEWRQDEDTLDTWFSSGLWTFSTLGWPEKTHDLKKFHPTDVMVTGWDILFFWVARMSMLSLYLLDEVPFRTVYLHGLVLDRDGKKMSKSKGTGIDPIEMQKKFGTDALRMALIVGNAPGQDFRMYEEKVEGFRNFANKLWNIGRYVNTMTGDSKKKAKQSVADDWILYRLNETIASVTSQIDELQLSTAGQTLYDFVWRDLADWYIEWSKFQPNPAVLRSVYEQTLKLLHPFMPFITEGLWADMYPNVLLMVATWPRPKARKQSLAITVFQRHQNVISHLRTFRAHIKLGGSVGEVVAPESDVLAWQALSRIPLRPVGQISVTDTLGSVTLGGVSFGFPAGSIMQFEGWRAKERARLRTYIDSLRTKLNVSTFVSQAPPNVVEAERQKLTAAEETLRSLD